MYQDFAKVYDHLMPSEMYNDWMEYTEQVVGDVSLHKVLDLGCGSGDFLQLVESTGAVTMGVDISPEMLKLAAHKVKADLYLQSMLDLTGLPTASLVTSFCDSVCYLTQPDDWLTLFQAVHDFLPNQGWFLFDVHSLGTLANFDDFMYRDQLEDGTDLIWESEVVEEVNRLKVHHHLTIYQPIETKEHEEAHFEKKKEHHIEVTYSMDQIEMMLKQAGFNQVNVTSDFGQEVASDSSERLFFACRKG
ncbi:class I SAM-dependent DNA methyltransferase [Atopobacter phocae]|uniref:class I SAM-dependent DNA methyltransferase n=1 Tax=Atopobacter phocae TaxID=136492 RepID=UPI00046F6DAE|nr:class I SAM-dependent methyltransferase [Atopobacter phocae]